MQEVAKSVVVALAVLVAGRGVAAGDPLPDEQVHKADKLFQEGRALLATNLLQACAKFDESLRYNSAAIGTILNVALCDEKLGKVASAVARFTEARERAKEQGLPEHMKAADEHIADLTPQVPHVSVALAEQLPNTAVLVDDRVIPLDALANVPVDPGERVIVVSAPQRLPYRAAFVIAKAEHRDVRVPALAKAIVVSSARRRVGQLTTLAGVVAIGSGLGVGLWANHRYDAQFEGEAPHCTTTPHGPACDTTGQSATDSARTLGNVGTLVGIAGVVATGVGLYLWLRAPSETSDARVSVVPTVGADGAGLAALGRF